MSHHVVATPTTQCRTVTSFGGAELSLDGPRYVQVEICGVNIVHPFYALDSNTPVVAGFDLIVAAKLTIDRKQSDGTESWRFTAVTEKNELCIVYLARYKGEEDKIIVGNYLLLTDVVVTHKPDIIDTEHGCTYSHYSCPTIMPHLTSSRPNVVKVTLSQSLGRQSVFTTHFIFWVFTSSFCLMRRSEFRIETA